MKLAQALMERADLQRRLAQLERRLQQNALYQEGEMPSENPSELLSEYFHASEQLKTLVVAINQANHRITLSDGINMTEALAQRDRLKAEHSMLTNLANAAMPEQARYSRSEIKTLSAIDIKAIRKQADDTAKRCRELDIKIQEANWLNELVEI